jgi:hypothetical protein
MRRLLLFAVSAFSLSALLIKPIRAQVAVYGTFSPAHLSNVQTGVIYTGTAYQNQTTSFWAPGIGGGVTLNFVHLGIATLGLDLRGSTKPGTSGADTAMGGIKLGFNPPMLRIKPYVQGSVGYLATRTTNVSAGVAGNTTFNNQSAVYEILGGIDYPLYHFVDYRIVEVGVGQGFLSLVSYNPTLFTINTGIVVHF